MTVTLYRLKEAELPPKEFEYVGEEYRRFLLTRDNAHLFWKIETLEQGPPPAALEGLYTSRMEAREAIDVFQERENRKKDDEASPSHALS